MCKEGIIFDISRCCINDGPGIRTTVFLKGCPLNCVWCHNPESQSYKPEILYAFDMCTRCGMCARVCPEGCHTFREIHTFSRKKCIGCGKCAMVCKPEALRLAGKSTTVENVIKDVLKDRVFYEESGGGMTVSGGEPLMQIDFLESLLKTAKQKGVHTCTETSGYAPKKHFERIAPYTDCFLFDWKETNSEKHKLFTGADNHTIYENLSYLNQIGAQMVLRLPLIPGYNDTEEHILGTAKVVNENKSITSVEILPYHPLGISKTKELGRKNDKCSPIIPDKFCIDSFLNRLQQKVNVSVTVSL